MSNVWARTCNAYRSTTVARLTHSLTASPLSLGGGENDTCREVDESATDTASPAGKTDNVTPVPKSNVSGAVMGTT